MLYLLAALGIWLVIDTLEIWFVGSAWVWRLLSVILGYGAAWLINHDDWWIGLGIAGLAALTKLLADLVLVAADAAKVAVLRHSAGRKL